MDIDYGESRLFCGDPVCPSPLGKLSKISRGVTRGTKKTYDLHPDEPNSGYILEVRKLEIQKVGMNLTQDRCSRLEALSSGPPKAPAADRIDGSRPAPELHLPPAAAGIDSNACGGLRPPTVGSLRFDWRNLQSRVSNPTSEYVE